MKLTKPTYHLQTGYDDDLQEEETILINIFQPKKSREVYRRYTPCPGYQEVGLRLVNEDYLDWC